MATEISRAPAGAPVLEVENLQTHFFTRGGVVKAVNGLDLKVGAGEILGLVEIGRAHV